MGNCLGAWYQRLGFLSDIEAAIKHTETTLAVISEGNSNQNYLIHAAVLGSLSSFLNARYWRLRALSDLEGAIGYAEEALAATDEDRPDPNELSSLSSFLGVRYERLGALGDFEMAIEHAEAALEATPGDYPDCAERLNNLSYFRYYKMGSDEDRERAFRSYLGTWGCLMSPPLVPVLAARKAAELFPPE